MFKFISLATLALISTSAYAADCVLTIDRTPCAGKDAEARKPYSGKNPTEEKTKAKDEATCMADATKASKIVRKGLLSKKVVTAKFDGKDIGNKEDSSACK